LRSNRSADSSTRLSERTYQRCLQKMISYLDSNAFIRNRDIRRIAGITYDQAIAFFNRAVAEKRVKREGISSGTRYRMHVTDPDCSSQPARIT
jgi:hypothetical protein